MLAFALWVEAAADRRIEGDVWAQSLLVDMRDRARDVVAKRTGAPFCNPLFPVRS